MNNFNYLTIGFCSLLLMLICFTSCEQQEVLVDEVSNSLVEVPAKITQDVPDNGPTTPPAELSSEEINSTPRSEHACIFGGNVWLDLPQLGWVWVNNSSPGASWLWINRHQAYAYVPVQDCRNGYQFFISSNNTIAGKTGWFFDNSNSNNSVYSYSAGSWIQY